MTKLQALRIKRSPKIVILLLVPSSKRSALSDIATARSASDPGAFDQTVKRFNVMSERQLETLKYRASAKVASAWASIHIACTHSTACSSSVFSSLVPNHGTSRCHRLSGAGTAGTSVTIGRCSDLRC